MDLAQLATVAFLVLGLLVGSFLNVVIHRLPVMLERAWAREYQELQGEEPPESPAYNLLVPRSHCPHCNHGIRWYENVPVVSYAVLRGRCSACKQPISPRYPLVEVITGLLFAWCGHRWGISLTALTWSGFAAALVTLTLIDWDTTLLPDDITLPLVWAGMVAAYWGISGVPLASALWGAIFGYVSLWSVYWLFKLATGKEGMGYGDFKLLAGLGAWFGWEALLPIILMSSIIGAVVGIALKMNSKLREGGYMPFGPFLAGAGLVSLLVGTDVTRRMIGI